MKKQKVLLIVLSVLAAGVLLVLILNWDASKKGAKDAWEGKYEPPVEKTE